MNEAKLRIFISWSGELSQTVATELKGLLEHVSDLFDPWMSSRSIESGDRGLTQIEHALKDTSVGIIVITRDNQESPWLNFEAGALSKQVEPNTTRVIPLLVDLSGSDLLQGPLSQFQYRSLNRGDLTTVITDLAALAAADSPRVMGRLADQWEAFEHRVTLHMSELRHPSRPKRRETRDMVEETLELVRELSRGQLYTTRPPLDVAGGPPGDSAKGTMIRTIRKVFMSNGYPPDAVLEAFMNDDGGLTILLRGTRLSAQQESTLKEMLARRLTSLDGSPDVTFITLDHPRKG